MSGRPRQDFSDSEKACILNLMLKYGIHNKPKREKYASWVCLAQEYNSIESNTKRTVEQLRKFWFNFQHHQQELFEDDRPSKMRRYTVLYDSDATQATNSFIENEIEKEEIIEFNDFGPCSVTESIGQDTRTQGMREELALVQENYRLTWEKEEELHKLRVMETEWLVQAAEVAYKTAVVHKEAAQEQLQSNKAKRKLAEFELNNFKVKHNIDGSKNTSES